MNETSIDATQETVEATAGASDLVTHAVRDRAADARVAAARAWDATSLFASRFVYTTCYTISYGVVFPAVLLARSVPRNNVAVRALIDGAQAAIQKVDQLRIGSIETPHDTPMPALAPA